MGNLADQGSPARANGTTDSTSTNGASGADEGAVDLIHVCRSAMLRRAEYQFYRTLLLAFPETGSPPDRATLRQRARRFGVPLEATLAVLAREDLIQRDPTTGAIRVAYPFSGVPTAHHVTLLADPVHSSIPATPADASNLDGAAGNAGAAPLSLYAMCALDALGAPLMLHRNALVTSVDPLTQEKIRVHIWQADAIDNTDAASSGKDGGLPGWKAQWEPGAAVVYARPEDPSADTSDIAAACRCPVTNFFATMAHARQWAEQHGSPGDVILSAAEALQRADRRFGGILDRLDKQDHGGQGAQSDQRNQVE